MDALGLAVFLTTQEERNVTFYRRLGFAVIADEICVLPDRRHVPVLDDAP